MRLGVEVGGALGFGLAAEELVRVGGGAPWVEDWSKHTQFPHPECSDSLALIVRLLPAALFVPSSRITLPSSRPI